MYVWLAVGSEILGGNTVDTNLQTLVEAVGSRAWFGLCVEDSISSLSEAFEYITSRAHKLGGNQTVRAVVCGGLGPTSDDLTLEAFSAWSGLDLVVVEELVAKIRGGGCLCSSSSSLVKLAKVPRGFNYLENEVGTAPLIWGSHQGVKWFFLPGVPGEFRWFVNLPTFKDLFGVVEREFKSKIQVFFQPEAAVFDHVRTATDEFKEDVGFYPKGGVVEIIIKSKDEGSLTARINRVREALKKAGIRFVVSNSDLTFLVHQLLIQQGLTVGTAESFTGGLLASELTRYPGSSKYFKGGFVVYSVEAKSEVLGLKVDNPVSESVAVELAESCARTLSCDVAISTTGVAGPGHDSWGNPEGLLYVGLWFKNRVKTASLAIKSNRSRIIQDGVRLGLLSLLEKLQEPEA